jgi:kynurenine formamidase
MLRHVDEAKRLAALGLVREGRLFDLGRVLDESVPVFGGRYYRQTLVTTAHHANGEGVGDNRVNWITEIVSGTQQLGTHLDALSHLQEGDRGYGGISVAELAGDAGVRALGVETVPQIVTCGWLVDAPGLGPGDVIGLQHVRDIDPAPGDAVLFHTGWGEHWADGDTYLSSARAWPPFLVRGRPRAGRGVRASLIGTVRRRDGTRQVTYRGHPLYYYVGDTRPGEVSCQNVVEFGGTWLVVAPSGRAIR